MILIDKHISELVAGYKDILKAEIDLRNRWRIQLLQAYAQRLHNYEIQVQRQAWLHGIPVVGWMVAGVIILAGVGIGGRALVQEDVPLLMACCGSPLMILLGVLILGALRFSHRGGGKAKTNRVPLHPLREHGVFPDLRKAWLHGLSGGIMAEVPDDLSNLSKSEGNHTAQGKRHFIRQLMEACCDTDYVLACTKQGDGTDVDVMLVGNKGVWIFDTKHWDGEIYWDDQGWRRAHAQSDTGGQEFFQEVAIDETPDQHWTRAAAEVTRTLQEQASDVLERYPALSKVRGGIVFTRPDAILKIQPGRPSYWGKSSFWIKTLQELESKAELDTLSVLRIVEVLLERHHALSPVRRRRSMRAYAQGVLQEAEQQLIEWVQRDL